MSAHGAPVRSRQKIPFNTRRSSPRFPPRTLFGNNGAITDHSKSVRSNRAIQTSSLGKLESLFAKKRNPLYGYVTYSADLNILKVGDWYYAAAYSWAWPPGCGSGKGQPACLSPDATCPMRTANILDPASWRGWDGKDFTVTFVDPYKGPVAEPKAHVCAPVPYLD